jgi:DNA-binding transcriptional ArsR family regulator
MQTFIRAVEYWVPSADRTTLAHGGGWYAAAPAFGALSAQLCFGPGEGLPGQAWSQGHPIVLRQFEGSYFKRTVAAHAAGLTCAIAIPLLAGDYLMAVVVMFCGDDAAHAGAIELWRNDPAQSPDMTLADAYYGTTAEAFEYIARHVSFRRGTGLPGIVWDTGMPMFIDDLGRGQRFLRAASATKVGINRGLAIPCANSGSETWVLAFLSALGSPLARRIEVWLPDIGRTELHRVAGFCELLGKLPAGESERPIARGASVIGQTLVTGIPAISRHAGDEPGELGASAKAAGLQVLLAMPLLRDGRLLAVIGWYF